MASLPRGSPSGHFHFLLWLFLSFFRYSDKRTYYLHNRLFENKLLRNEDSLEDPGKLFTRGEMFILKKKTAFIMTTMNLVL